MDNNLNLKQHNQSINVIEDTVANDKIIKGVKIHPRYLNDFEDNIIKLDLRHFQSSEPKIVEFDLSKINFAGHGEYSVHNKPLTFSEFPYICETLKLH